MTHPPAEWRWFGHAGHLFVSQDCRFHLRTEVGDYLISTVGEYLPEEGVRELLAPSRGITLEGRGDDRRADWMAKVGYERLGAGPHRYETMVFKLGTVRACSDEECGCGAREPESWSEIDGSRWMTAGEAQRGHMELCHKYAAAAPGRGRKHRSRR